MPHITVRYFAIFREQADRELETLDFAGGDAAALYEMLKRKYGFTVPGEAIRVAINNEFGAMTADLQDQDEVAFIAPVAGG